MAPGNVVYDLRSNDPGGKNSQILRSNTPVGYVTAPPANTDCTGKPTGRSIGIGRFVAELETASRVPRVGPESRRRIQNNEQSALFFLTLVRDVVHERVNRKKKARMNRVETSVVRIST